MVLQAYSESHGFMGAEPERVPLPSRKFCLMKWSRTEAASAIQELPGSERQNWAEFIGVAYLPATFGYMNEGNLSIHHHRCRWETGPCCHVVL